MGYFASAPDDALGIDLPAAAIAGGILQRDLAFFAVGADVGIQQHAAVLAQDGGAMRAGAVLPFEIPDVPAVRTAVVRHDSDAAVDEIPLRRRVVPRAVGAPLLADRDAGAQQ